MVENTQTDLSNQFQKDEYRTNVWRDVDETMKMRDGHVSHNGTMGFQSKLPGIDLAE
jgi:hypothetical protein